MTTGWGTDSNAAEMKRLHARNARQLIVLQNELNETRGKLAGAERRHDGLQAKVDAVEAIVRHGRAVSAGPRAIVYVADLEVALCLATELAPSKLGANGAADLPEVPHE